MLRDVGFENLDGLIEAAIPKNIRLNRQLNLPEARSESEALAELRAISKKNKVLRSFIGAGYSDCITPPVIQRNILENPGWYTAYTPYQAELAQGRLEALLNFQTMIVDLTKLDVANASLLDEATTAAEAMALCHAVVPNRKIFFVSDNCHPQTIRSSNSATPFLAHLSNIPPRTGRFTVTVNLSSKRTRLARSLWLQRIFWR